LNSTCLATHPLTTFSKFDAKPMPLLYPRLYFEGALYLFSAVSVLRNAAEHADIRDVGEVDVSRNL